MTDFLFFAPLFRRQAGRLALSLLLAALTLFFGTMLLGVSGWFLTGAALAGSIAAFNLFVPSSLVRMMSFLRIASRYGERLAGHDATLRLLADIRAFVFAGLFPRLPVRERDARHGDLVSRLVADVEALDTAFLTAIVPIASALAIGGGLTLGLHLLLPAAAPFVAAASLLCALAVPGALVLATGRAGARAVETSAELRTAVIDGMEGHTDLVTLGLVDDARAGLAASGARLSKARRRIASLSALASFTVMALTAGAFLAVLWFGLEALEAGALSGPLLAGLLLATLGSFEVSGAIVRSVAKFGAARAAAGRLRRIVTAEAPVRDPARPVALAGGGEVSFEAVTFGFEGGRPVLQGLDLDVAPGERVAVLGASGSGKSTLLTLLLRLADPQGGRVRVGGTDIRTVAQGALHERVAFMAQDAPVFTDTIRDNLLIARPEASDAALWQALEAARLADHVRSLPAGLDTPLGEAGRTLSAGEARRLCLARTLLSPAPVVALDEPTSGLDRDTELAFFADLKRATEGRTVVLVTHAALPAGTVDRTFRMVAGKLVEERSA
ncbi:thiol reductant ABC exporter subunit CydC [Aureimonas populi]|uniref:Thiol reductant ABC exporter subunit CydC n=1 Tax=Aureimonas populi TaxID=1701758 RepID=A0ABW5CRZ1_9HYPH|nr:thiol reductant ABC exporter subunit CydC [Aureimonas populi]